MRSSTLIKTPEEIARIRKAGRILARVLKACAEAIEPNRTTGAELNALAERLVLEMGGFPAFKGYRLYPAALCVSINETIVHGLPDNRVLREGDLVSLDMGVFYEGYCADAALTVAVGRVDYPRKRLMRVTEEAFYEALKVAQAGNTIGDIGAAIQGYVEQFGFRPAHGLAGHGVGRYVHEPPEVPNEGEPGEGPRLQPGMVLAIEPMIVMGKPDVAVAEDGWAIITADRQPASHYEHTIVITENGAEILTVE
ncbi:Methionine aminopeptidase 1 [bacterium HR15]|nr:Methionine aminopeptidase 1 [bacterium HR15]